MTDENEKFMKIAIKEAEKSIARGYYGIGSVVVKDNKIISKGTNETKTKFDPTLHAEIGAIRKACKKLKEGYIKDCTIYSTHEPCSMCASAIYWAKAKRVVYGITREDMIEYMNKKANENFAWRQIDLSCEEILNKSIPNLNIEVVRGFMREECLKLKK